MRYFFQRSSGMRLDGLCSQMSRLVPFFGSTIQQPKHHQKTKEGRYHASTSFIIFILGDPPEASGAIRHLPTPVDGS